MTTPELYNHIQERLNPGETMVGVLNALQKEAEHGSSRRAYPQHGFSLMYTSNSNYAQGKKNGGGSGLYAVLYKVGMCKTVKLIDA